MGLTTPMHHGGTGMDYLAYAIAMEEISRGCAGTGTIVTAHNVSLMADLMKWISTFFLLWFIQLEYEKKKANK